MPAPDFAAIAAKEAESLPPDWTPRIYRACGDLGYELIGAVPIGYVSRGVRKGRPKFPPLQDMQKVYVSHDQIERIKAAWQQETGLCARCGGDGQIIAAIYTNRVTYRPCPDCLGTGEWVAP